MLEELQRRNYSADTIRGYILRKSTEMTGQDHEVIRRTLAEHYRWWDPM